LFVAITLAGACTPDQFCVPGIVYVPLVDFTFDGGTPSQEICATLCDVPPQPELELSKCELSGPDGGIDAGPVLVCIFRCRAR
jgi:hypothetical protein